MFVRFLVALCALFTICQAKSVLHLHAPTNLSVKWIDPLTVNVSWSWKRPKALPLNCHIRFEYKLNETIGTSKTYFLANLLTETSVNWNYSIWTVSSCKEWNHSRRAKVFVTAPKARAQVTDFKCYLSNSDLNCSWIPNSSPMSLSYRDCGHTAEVLKQEFRECDQTSDTGARRVCHLKGRFLTRDLCMVATALNTTSTFTAPKTVRLPKEMKVSEEGTNLVLTLMPLEVHMSYFYNVCYSVCDKPMDCLEHKMEGKNALKIPYDKSCPYKLRYQACHSDCSASVHSDWSEDSVYGSTDMTLTVVAILIPIFVSFTVILSCICFRRHKDIICPDVPDPSVIFKEMINGNKDMKLKEHMYSPVQEPIEPIVIVPHVPPDPGSGVST